jgi:cell wall-associated NlpC family hydrolase
MGIEQQILHHAAAEAPLECCGLAVSIEGQLRYLPCKNIADCPELNFEISPDDWLRAQLQGDILAVVHSHPGGPNYLSEADRAIQKRTACEWWLASRGDLLRFRNCLPLLGRQFLHGTTDCYTLIRDAYHLAGIELPEAEREDGWWLGEQELYLENIVSAGFSRLADDTPQPGDVLLICLGSARANHAAIYCGDQTILHHVPHRLSRRDTYGGYWQQYTHSIWRHQAWQPSAFTAICNDMAAAFT